MAPSSPSVTALSCNAIRRGWFPARSRYQLPCPPWLVHGDDEVFSASNLSNGLTSTTLPPLPHSSTLKTALAEPALHEASAARPTDRTDQNSAYPPVASILKWRSSLEQAIALYLDRCNTSTVPADAAGNFLQPGQTQSRGTAQHLTDEVRPAIADFAKGIADVVWEAPAINAFN